MHKGMIAAIGIICLGISIVRANEIEINFDGNPGTTTPFMEAIKNAGSCQNDKIGCEEPKAEAIIERPAFIQTASAKRPPSKQPLIKRIISDYNAQILHDTTIAENLKAEGVIVAFKLPGEILITKNDETLSVIKDAALLETIRLALLENDRQYRQAQQCIDWVIETVWIYVQGVLTEKAIKVCAEYAADMINNPPPAPAPTPHPYPQAPGYSSGCYTQPSGQVICE